MPPPALTSRLTVVLFTDLVGSTDLKSRIGTLAYLALIVRHDTLFKQAMLAHGGQGAEVVDHAGDSHFAVFPSASAAVRTALAFHQSIGAEPWEHGPVQTRVGSTRARWARRPARTASARSPAWPSTWAAASCPSAAATRPC